MENLHGFQAPTPKILNNQEKRVIHKSLANKPKLRDSVKKQLTFNTQKCPGHTI